MDEFGELSTDKFEKAAGASSAAAPWNGGKESEVYIMAGVSEELKQKVMTAQSVDEVASLLGEAGMDEGEAQQIWDQVSSYRKQKELSLDEMEAISGGRDWTTEGCAATMEPNSWCWSNDWCVNASVYYTSYPSHKKCENCKGKFITVYREDGYFLHKCRACGWSKKTLG